MINESLSNDASIPNDVEQVLMEKYDSLARTKPYWCHTNETCAPTEMYIIGASGHGRVVANIVLKWPTIWKLVGFLDDYVPKGNLILKNFAVLGKVDDYLGFLIDRLNAQLGQKESIHFAIAIGDNFKRKQMANRIRQRFSNVVVLNKALSKDIDLNSKEDVDGNNRNNENSITTCTVSLSKYCHFPTILDPMAVVNFDSYVGEGSVLNAFVNVGPNCSVGSFCILNTRSSLDHDSTMKDYSSIAPGVTTGGKIMIGSRTFIGLGSMIKHGISIADDVVIGMGSVVLKSISTNKVVAFGYPCQVQRDRKPEESYL